MKKIKFSNISTKGNETQNQPSKSKRKNLKAFGFGSLAMMMAVAGTFAFAPLGASPSVANANEIEMTTEQGLITPKADDPVIYTTESGIEIKFGNAPSVSNSLSSGNLNGFPYFTTTKNSTTYTWVIIGRSTSITDTQTYLWSNWKNGNKDFYKYMSYFFGDTYETNTPAGSLINSIVPSKAYVVDTLKNTKPKTSSEIPAGCVLALSNTVVGSTFFSNTAQATYNGQTGNCANSLTQCFAGSGNNLTTVHQNYYTNDSFGFGTNKSLLQNIALRQAGTYWYNPGTGGYNKKDATSINLYFFPLGHDASYDNFRFQTYLTAEQVKTSSSFWVRTNDNHTCGRIINTSGVVAEHTPQTYSMGLSQSVRPACVVKIF